MLFSALVTVTVLISLFSFMVAEFSLERYVSAASLGVWYVWYIVIFKVFSKHVESTSDLDIFDKTI